MLTVEEIKKGCEFADGFSTHQDSNLIHSPDNVYWENLDSKTFTNIVYPLFLQRVIEGINSEFIDEQQIVQCGYSIQVLSDFNRILDFNYDIVDDFDQAKEQAIKYILE